MNSLNLVWVSNQIRNDRLDFWGAVGLVCAIGVAAKIAQTLLT